MEYVRLALVFLHLIGLSMLLGGFAVQALVKAPRVNPAMVYGVLTQLVTGFLLAAPLRHGHEPDPAKLVVKGLVAVLIAAMVIVVRNKERVAAGHFYAIGGMTLLNVAVAVFWR